MIPASPADVDGWEAPVFLNSVKSFQSRIIFQAFREHLSPEPETAPAVPYAVSQALKSFCKMTEASLASFLKCSSFASQRVATVSTPLFRSLQWQATELLLVFITQNLICLLSVTPSCNHFTNINFFSLYNNPLE